MSTNPKNLVKIGLVFAEIIRQICQFFTIHLIGKHTIAPSTQQLLYPSHKISTDIIWNMVKISPVLSDIMWLESRPQKRKKN